MRSLRKDSKVWAEDRDSTWVAPEVPNFAGKQVLVGTAAGFGFAGEAASWDADGEEHNGVDDMTKLTYLNEPEVLYILVTDSGDDDQVNPRPGTLRHTMIQDEPLWVTFKRDMVIRLKNELVMNSFKTIDGQGASVHFGDDPCITVHYATNIIIHGIHIHDCKQSGNAMIRDTPWHYGWWTVSDGESVSIFDSKHIWVDHCSLSNCHDGLIDANHGSTAITIIPIF